MKPNSQDGGGRVSVYRKWNAAPLATRQWATTLIVLTLIGFGLTPKAEDNEAHEATPSRSRLPPEVLAQLRRPSEVREVDQFDPRQVCTAIASSRPVMEAYRAARVAGQPYGLTCESNRQDVAQEPIRIEATGEWTTKWYRLAYMKRLVIPEDVGNVEGVLEHARREVHSMRFFLIDGGVGIACVDLEFADDSRWPMSRQVRMECLGADTVHPDHLDDGVPCVTRLGSGFLPHDSSGADAHAIGLGHTEPDVGLGDSRPELPLIMTAREALVRVYSSTRSEPPSDQPVVIRVIGWLDSTGRFECSSFPIQGEQ